MIVASPSRYACQTLTQLGLASGDTGPALAPSRSGTHDPPGPSSRDQLLLPSPSGPPGSL
eukprot:151468-Rhodomonas_salina.1